MHDLISRPSGWMSAAGPQGGCCHGHRPGHGHRRHVHLIGNTAMLVWKIRSVLRLFADAMACTSMILCAGMASTPPPAPGAATPGACRCLRLTPVRSCAAACWGRVSCWGCGCWARWPCGWCGASCSPRGGDGGWRAPIWRTTCTTASTIISITPTPARRRPSALHREQGGVPWRWPPRRRRYQTKACLRRPRIHARTRPPAPVPDSGDRSPAPRVLSCICPTPKRRFSRVLWRLFTLLAQAVLFALCGLKGRFGGALLRLNFLLDVLEEAGIVARSLEVKPCHDLVYILGAFSRL
jgi:hypothetical protein